MVIDDLRQVNRLWKRIYPYLASQIMESFQKDSGLVLELGPFAGGISLALSRLHPDLRFTIADESSEVLEYLREEITYSGLPQGMKIQKTSFDYLIFQDSQFDLVIFRGAFFFLRKRENLLRELFRVLNDEGMAFVGGGYGKDTPQQLIDEIADESRRLNNLLGRERFTMEELEELGRKSNLPDTWEIEQEGGLWVKIRKERT
jgi:ubiquinone/menaquinone biosynthesis C-methylase UbiE